MEAVALVAAVAERLVRGAAAAAERCFVAFVDDGTVAVHDPHIAADEQRPVGDDSELGLLCVTGDALAGAARAQRARRAARDGGLDVLGTRRLDVDPRTA